MSRERKHNGAVVYSVALHVAVVAALSVSVHLPSWQREAGLPAPIQASIVDQSAIEKREQAVRDEQQRQQREEKQRRDAEQKAQRDREETAKREQQLKDKQALELKEKQAREQKAREDAAKREQEQKAKAAQDAKDKQAREQKAREDAIKRKQQQQAEDDLQRQLAAEADRQAAERSGLMDKYVRDITDKIQRNWTRPLSAKPGLDCVISVVQLPTGDVIEKHVTSCNGDDAVMRSIEAAVQLASPLPRPDNPNLFERNLNVRFRPEIQ